MSIINDSTFWLSLSTLFIGFGAVIIRSLYRSKCENFSCCFGLIDMVRNVSVERELDLRNSNTLERDDIPNRT
jgi:hypothetical protein